jgi:hypothetical protein
MEKRIGKRLGSVQPTPARLGTPDCPVVHRTVSGVPGWFAWKGRSRDSTAAYGSNSPDRPVSHPRRTRRPREKQRGDVAIIHRTVRWCIGLCGEPTVACANGRPRNLRATRGRANSRQGAPDYPVCTGQCPVRQLPPRTNGRMHQKRKEIAHRTATVTVRWCTGLSGAPPGRTQVWPSMLASNGY